MKCIGLLLWDPFWRRCAPVQKNASSSNSAKACAERQPQRRCRSTADSRLASPAGGLHGREALSAVDTAERHHWSGGASN